MTHRFMLLLGAALVTAPALANSLIPPGPREKIARSTLSASPADEWNRLSRRGGKNVEIWTIDGDELNKLTFYGGVPVGQALLKERDKKNAPLPRVGENMLITDIPTLLESTYRIQFDTDQMSIDLQEPATVGGHKGIRFTYSFVHRGEDLRRKGEAVGAFVDGRLFLVSYEGPAIHYFEKDVAKFRQVADTLKF